MIKDTPEEFFRYLKCRIDLFPQFIFTNNNVFFREEFTYENWLKGVNGKACYGGAMDISSRRHKTALRTISAKGIESFGQLIKVKDSVVVQEGFEYSIYRFVKYNFKRKIFINGKPLNIK